ncbi:MAG: DUF6356 family protein [Steroidobacteraceae bacterium]
MLSRIFLEHPRSVGETYLAHQQQDSASAPR